MLRVALNCEDYVLREQMDREIHKIQEEFTKKLAEKEKAETIAPTPATATTTEPQHPAKDETLKKLEARIKELETALAEAKGISVETIQSKTHSLLTSNSPYRRNK